MWTSVKFFLGLSLALYTVGCAQRDVPVRPDDSRDRFSARNAPKADANQNILFRWAQIHIEKLTEVKKLVERGLGTAVVPACTVSAGSQDVGEAQQKTLSMTACQELRAGTSASGSWEEVFRSSAYSLELFERSFKLELSAQDPNRTRWPSATLALTTNLWAHRLTPDAQGVWRYLITYRDKMLITPNSETDKASTWLQTTTAEALVDNSGKVIGLNSILSNFSELDEQEVLRGGLVWRGDLKLDGSCTQPQGTLAGMAVREDGSTGPELEVRFYGERGMADGVSGQRAARFPCDQNLLPFYMPILARDR